MAWAIDLRLNDKPGFLGFLGMVGPYLQPWQDGCHIALWRTRAAAKESLDQARAKGGEWAREHYWNRARIVRARVTIEATR